MYIPFTCPHCGSFTEVEAQFAGQSGPCYSCGKTVLVPQAPPVPGSGGAAVASRPAGASLSTIGAILGMVSIGVIAFVGLVAVLLWVLSPAITAGGAAAQQAQCGGNLMLIGNALEKYHQKNGSYPPAYIADAQGKPMHSWRVLLLPYLNEQSLFDRYDMSQPWDSPQNMLVARRMPAVYGCSADSSARSNGETSYLAVVGSGTAFPGTTKVRKSQIVDGLGSTLLIVESHSSGIGWTEPRDLDRAKMLYQVNGGSSKGGGGQEITSQHKGGAHVLLADGRTEFVGNKTPTEFIEGLVTIDSKDPIPPEIKRKNVAVDEPFK